MNEHCLRVVISGPGEQQVQLRLPGGSPDRQVVLHVASLGALRLPRQDESPGEATLRRSSPTAVSFELRWSEPAPAPTAPAPLPPREPAPLAMAWAMAQRLRQRQPSSVPPRPRSTREPG